MGVRVDSLPTQDPDILDEMLTPGTSRNEAYTWWMGKLKRLGDELQAFVTNMQWMLKEFFQDRPTWRQQDYIQTYAGYRKVMEEAMNQKKDGEDEGKEWGDRTVDLDTVSFEYPVNISLVSVMVSRSHRLTLAEQMTFESLTSFLYMDLYKGMATGNLPRRCAHCRRWFLTVGGYDARYCDRAVPGTGGKTCRKVGAHAREKEKQKNETAAREYSRIYNRLKARKRRGRIAMDEWRRQVVQAKELKDAFLAKQITQQEYVQRLDEL